MSSSCFSVSFENSRTRPELNHQKEKTPHTLAGITVPFGKSCRHPVSVTGFPFNRDKLALMDATPVPQPVDELSSIGHVTVPVLTVPPRIPQFCKLNSQLPPTIVTDPLNIGCPM